MSSPVFQSQYEDINHEGRSREGRSREWRSREGRSREGRSREGTPREERSRERTHREERSREGRSREGTPREGRTFNGTSREGPACSVVLPWPSSLAVHGHRLKGCCLPLSRRCLECQLGTSNVSKEVHRQCTRIMQARMAPFFCHDSGDKFMYHFVRDFFAIHDMAWLLMECCRL